MNPTNPEEPPYKFTLTEENMCHVQYYNRKWRKRKFLKHLLEEHGFEKVNPKNMRGLVMFHMVLHAYPNKSMKEVMAILVERFGVDPFIEHYVEYMWRNS